MKYTFHPQTTAPSLDSDLLRLLSIIRERESALVILFEERHQRNWERAEWLLKQCEYQEKESRLSREIRSLVLRWVLMGEEACGQEDGKQARSFWVKVKMVIKMSLERMKLLNLLNYQLFEQYQAIIEGMNQGYDRAGGISHYRDIEEMIKNRNRTIHDLFNCPSKPPQSFRQRYQLSANHLQKESPSESKIQSPVHFIKAKDLATFDPKPIRRPLSHQSHKNHINSKDFLFSKKIRNVEKLIGNYEDKLGDLMAAKIDIALDKKKSLQHNIDALIDGLMQRNTNNHKAISKYIFLHSGRKLRRLHSKKQLRPAIKKMIESETPKTTQKQKKKAKFTLAYDRAASAKLKRKQIKQIHKFRQSQIFEGQRGRHKKLLIR